MTGRNPIDILWTKLFMLMLMRTKAMIPDEDEVQKCAVNIADWLCGKYTRTS